MTSPIREYTTISHPKPNTRVWHEIQGDGQPLVLLHGAFSGASSWGGQVPTLVDAGWKVFCPERHGHGHSPDVTDEFHYADMAEEMMQYTRNQVMMQAGTAMLAQANQLPTTVLSLLA